MKELLVVNLGKTKYADAWELQKQIFTARLEQRIGDVLLLTEHDHVYTLGKAANDNHLLAKDEELSKKGVDVFWIDRGGDITYHGPGQIVGYPIIDLNKQYNDIHRYLRDIEEVIIRSLSEYGIVSGREPEFTGVWVKEEKIAAIGVKVSKWITMHGFALNVNTDISFYNRIIPCGIFHKGITTLQNLLGKEIVLEDVHQKLVNHFASLFHWEVKQISRGELTTMLRYNEAVTEETH
ncbi:MAG: lipoyl(octanoyl) transferase LipB [Ignavibacteriales bacterium]|nr:lipoyl(octanoyl) transferase LipB [Ignavibacteriales bacterium]